MKGALFMYFLMIDSDKLYSPKGYTRGAWLVYKCAKSSNFGRVNGRRHTFRLLDNKGKIRYRGYSVFPDNANFGALLRPLIDFGVLHGCNQIAYKVGTCYKRVPIKKALQLARLCGVLASVREFCDLYALRDLTEADAEQIDNYLRYVTEP